MTAPLLREIELFHEALERPPAERSAFIEAQCTSDPVQKRRLLRLLEAHQRAEDVEFEPVTSAIEPVPERIGPYRVLELLGEGGMGVVYSAEQPAPLRRRVAIKVIKLGMDTREVIARFEAERQALAMMDHPGVARAIDAGVTDLGRPYFVMELVKGLPLVEYCSSHRLALRERLNLFAEVCAAVQHAHHKGIIHRDLKPSNILVAIHEGRPTPKVIDFGVAKATAARLTERTLFTEQGQLMGTPEYMSPEQAEMSGLDVDARTDVYSLGVILYELLTGVLPFDSKALRAAGQLEILRTIREVDPPRPSTRLAELARGSDPLREGAGVPHRLVRGELDWIVTRAMEKDRTRRYRTANALAEDVTRYLSDRTVTAGPPSAGYVVRKFIKRHRYVTALISIALVSTIVGLAGLTAGLIRARDAEALATQRADNALAAAGFLEKVLFQADPEFGGGAPTLMEVMENAGRLIDDDLAQFPEVNASVRESLGVAYRRRSMFEAAAPHLRRSLEIRRQLFGDDDLRTARSSIALADLRFEHEGSIAEALRLLDRALRAYESHDLADSIAEAWLQLDVGMVRLAGDQLAGAERAFERCRGLLVRFYGPDHQDVSRPTRGLALVALMRGDLAEAERLARRAVALCEGEGAAYIAARARVVLAQVWIAGGRVEEASGQLDRSGAEFFGTVGRQHIRIAERQAVLGRLHLRAGEFETAEFITTACEDMRRQLLSDGHWAILEARLLRQMALVGLGEIESVEPELSSIADAIDRTLGPDHHLAIEVARGQRLCAESKGDAAARDAAAENLAKRVALRAKRVAAAVDENESGM